MTLLTRLSPLFLQLICNSFTICNAEMQEVGVGLYPRYGISLPGEATLIPTPTAPQPLGAVERLLQQLVGEPGLKPDGNLQESGKC